MGDQNQEDFLKDFQTNSNFDNFTQDLLNSLVNKETIYEPLKEAKAKIEQLIKDQPEENNIENKEKLALMEKMLNILEKEK